MAKVKQILCACGCGAKLTPGKPWQKYLNKRHGDRVRSRRRMAKVQEALRAMANKGGA